MPPAWRVRRHLNDLSVPPAKARDSIVPGGLISQSSTREIMAVVNIPTLSFVGSRVLFDFFEILPHQGFSGIPIPQKYRKFSGQNLSDRDIFSVRFRPE